MTRALATTIALFAAILGLCFVRYAPPSSRAEASPSGGSAPRDPREEDSSRSALRAPQASSARARPIQEAIAKEPRPVGSEANARARELLAAELVRAGYAVETQRTFQCGRHGTCAFVANVVASRGGRDPAAGAVLLAAHLDSVACSPGASDDGVGVAAVLEAARLLASDPPAKRGLVVLFTDGEEAGLLGALAFVREHPLAKTVVAAVNVDARGSGGPSTMFETSVRNRTVVGLFAQHATRPVTSSLFFEIYRRMPNDTDFTAFKSLPNVVGVNLANIAGIEHYHTTLDTVANADLGTLQHHADQAVAIARALANAESLAGDGADQAVWFDVLALGIVRWPLGWTLPLAALAFALVLGHAIRLRAFGFGVLSAPAVLGAAGAASLAGGALLRAVALPVPWVAHPGAALICVHSAAITAGVGLALVLGRSTQARLSLWAGTWLLWATTGLALAIAAPGAAFLFVVPALVAGVVGFLPSKTKSTPLHDAAAIAPAATSAVLLLPIALLVYDALSLAVPALATAPTILLLTTLVPLLDASVRRARAVVGALAGTTLAAGVVAALVPKFSPARPQRVNVVVREDVGDAGSTRVFVEAAWGSFGWGAPPASMIAALGPSTNVATSPTPFSAPMPNALTEPLGQPAPRAEVERVDTSGGRRRVHVRILSPRGASTMLVAFPTPAAGVDLTVLGQHGTPRNGALALRGVPPQGIEIDLESSSADSFEVVLYDIALGARSPVVTARPATAVPSQDGDLTVMSRRLQL